MTVLAIIVVACYAVALLPGSSLKQKRLSLRNDIDWRNPHPYVNLTGSIAAIALAILVLV